MTSPSSTSPETSAGKSTLLDRFPALRRLSSGRRPKKRLRHVQQTAATDCGAACLTMVLDYHGKSLRLDDVREVVGTGRAGADAMALLRGGRWFGLRGRGVKIDDIDSFQFLEPGTVLHWQFNHYVVLEHWGPKGASIVDPASGRRQVSREQLRRAFTGVALLFEPAEDFEPENTRTLGGQRYLRELKSQKGVLSRVLVMSILLQLLALAMPLLTSLLVDRVVPRSDYHLLMVLGAGLAAVVGFHFVSTLLRAHLMLQLRTQLDAKITLEFLDHLVALPYTYFQQRSSGDLMMRLNSNTTVREILTTSALSGILDGSLVSLYLLFMFLTHWQLSLLVLALAGLRIGLFLLVRRRQRELMSEALQTQAMSRGYQVQLFAGIETLKSIGAEERAVEQWSNLFIDELNVSLARGRLNAIFDTLLSTLAMASPFVILMFGTAAVLEGQLSLGVMLAFNALAMGFLGPLSTLISTGVQLQILSSYLERIDDVLESEPEQDRQQVAPAGVLQGTHSAGRCQLPLRSHQPAGGTQRGSGHRPRQLRRPGRSVGGGQVHLGQSAAGPLPTQPRTHPLRRRRPRHPRLAHRAPSARHRAAAALPFRHLHPRQHRLGGSRPHPAAGARRRPLGPGSRRHHGLAHDLRNSLGGRRPEPLRRATSTARLGPCLGPPPRHLVAGRGHQSPGRLDREARARGTHHHAGHPHRHRPPSQHRGGSGCHSGHAGG